MKLTILYFSCYQPLAEIRKLLIEGSDANVICSCNIAEALRLVTEEQIALIVVCNSCDEEVYRRFIGALQPSSPTIPVLRLEEGYPAAWRDPELVTALIRARLRWHPDAETTKKPPQSVLTFSLRKYKSVN
jgi:hypothetical protein